MGLCASLTDRFAFAPPVLGRRHRGRKRPNKRLKLTGGDRFNGSRVLCPDGARTVVHFTLRRRAGRPQLKRDPLGGALPPHKHPFVNSFWYGEYARRRAPMLPKGDLCSAPYTPRPRYGAAAPRTSFRRVAAHSQVLIPRAGAGSQRRAARSSVGEKRAV